MSRLAGSSKLLRAMNESAALAHLLERGQLTRADLRELTGLSKPTISEALRRLTDAGFANVVGHVSGGPGPNAEVYAANPAAAYAVAVSVRDSGDTDIPALAAAVCDLTGQVRGRVEAAVDFLATDPVSAIADVVARLVDGTGVPGTRIGHVQLGVAGSYDVRTESIHHVDVPGWNRPGLVREIRARLNTRVGVDNDVNLAAIAERRRGVGRDADGFALLWLGEEGLGLAIDLGGTLLRGARGGAGEIGYMPLFATDGQNRKVDLQDLVGGPAVLALAAEHGFRGRTAAEAVAAAAEALTEVPGPAAHAASPQAQSAAVSAPAGPAAARAAEEAAQFFPVLADRVAVGLAAVVAVLDPPLVVLAGEVAQAGGAPLLDAVTAAMAQAAPLETVIALTAISDDAVLLGALDAGLAEVREALIASVHESTT